MTSAGGLTRPSSPPPDVAIRPDGVSCQRAQPGTFHTLHPATVRLGDAGLRAIRVALS